MTSAPFIVVPYFERLRRRADIHHLCEEAVEYGFAAVCITPRLRDPGGESPVRFGVAVATVDGFPLGYQPPTQKAAEAAAA
ncbi:hypothetical protein JCM30471_13800 [Desulfuromonas carbonis]